MIANIPRRCMHSPQLPHASPLHPNLLVPHSLIKVDTIQHTHLHIHTCKQLCTHAHMHSSIHARTTHPHSHSLTHSCTHGHIMHTHKHTHTHIVAHPLSLSLSHTHTHTPQQVRSLLASGIKPDAERDQVSVFWCRLD